MPPDALLCLIVDDHPVVRQGIRALLEREMPGVEVMDAPTPAAAMALNNHPDVVVIDPSSAGAEVEKLVGELRRTLDSAIVVSQHRASKPYAPHCSQAGQERIP